jgi:hypothetical protein
MPPFSCSSVTHLVIFTPFQLLCYPLQEKQDSYHDNTVKPLYPEWSFIARAAGPPWARDKQRRSNTLGNTQPRSPPELAHLA